MLRRIQRRVRNQQRRRTRENGLMHLVFSTDGTPARLHDDCPICRSLRDSDEPVFTRDAFGNLAVVPR